MRANRISGRQDRAERCSPTAAALREPRRRSASIASLVDPIGHLDLFLTFSGFRILPTVARIDPSHRLTLNRSEVEEAFEVPLAS